MKRSLGVGILLLLSIIFLNFNCWHVNPEERYKKIMDQYLEAWNTGNVDLLDKVVTTDFQLRMTPRYKPVKGLDSLKYEIKNLRTTYPDFHINVHEIIYALHAVTVRWTITATNSGPGRMPPTGKAVDVPGMSILHIKDSKITDEWIAGNNLLWMEQLGFQLLAPQPGQ
jgi:steroid delta-isomerase-like uncharacterized protein